MTNPTPERLDGPDKAQLLALAERVEAEIEVICIECAGVAKLVGGKRIYPHRPDLYERHFYLCDCGAYCGTHRGTAEPLGYPCGPVTRAARSRAHAAFDPLWRGKNAPLSRGEAYAWLARRMGMRREDCHIGMMNADMANAAARFSAEYATSLRARAALSGEPK